MQAWLLINVRFLRLAGDTLLGHDPQLKCNKRGERLHVIYWHDGVMSLSTL